MEEEEEEASKLNEQTLALVSNQVPPNNGTKGWSTFGSTFTATSSASDLSGHSSGN